MRKLFSENIFFGNTCSLISLVDISELTFQKLKKVQLDKLRNIFKIDSSDEEVRTLESCYFLLLNSTADQKEKDVGAGNILRKNRTRSLT